MAYRMLDSRWRVGRISDWVEGDGQLSSLISVRAELGRADLRALYLGWLLCAQSGDLGPKADAKAFEIAVKTLTDEAAGRALLDAGSALAANQEVIRIATGITEAAIAKFGLDYFSLSERRMLAGVAPTLSRRLLP